MTSFFTTSSLITCGCVSGGVGDFIEDMFLERPNLNTRKAIATTMAATRTMKIGRKTTAITAFALDDDYPCRYNRLSATKIGHTLDGFEATLKSNHRITAKK
jgi:hypothetical protein